MKFIFLAAGKGERIFKKINKNKCLLELKNKTLIENSIDEVLKTLHESKIREYRDKCIFLTT